MDPPQELLVGADLTGAGLDPLELLVDQVVDPVERLHLAPLESRAITQDHHGRGRVLALISGKNGALTSPQGSDQPRVRYIRDLDVRCLEERVCRHVTLGAIGVGRDHRKLLGEFGNRNGRTLGLHPDRGDAWCTSVEAGAARDPVPEEVVVRGSGLQALTSLVGDLADGLQQEETSLGVDPIEAPSGQVVGQGSVVEARVVAAQ